ncbi:unnamed protein product [Eruca vesicaria subsp. sativa]|uniref:Uncharacterized protein n=1 Tax=Eruca vesicaria subsp. sativa TaxID=29727 RepID=A0ABC8M1G9_ERUVS|nr:unnamed protein product [Eruca vesicaria subsp. sativa]
MGPVGDHVTSRCTFSYIFCGASADDEMSEATPYFTSNWGDMEMGKDYWKNMIDHGYGVGDRNIEGVTASDDIINLSTDINMDEPTCTLWQRLIIDVVESSTNSTTNAEDIQAAQVKATSKSVYNDQIDKSNVVSHFRLVI